MKKKKPVLGKLKASLRKFPPEVYKLRCEYQLCEVIFFDPQGWKVEDYPKHPLKRNERCYFLGEIPNVPGHCLVFSRESGVVDMVHPEDFRKAREDEL